MRSVQRELLPDLPWLLQVLRARRDGAARSLRTGRRGVHVRTRAEKSDGDNRASRQSGTKERQNVKQPNI